MPRGITEGKLKDLANLSLYLDYVAATHDSYVAYKATQAICTGQLISSWALICKIDECLMLGGEMFIAEQIVKHKLNLSRS